MKLKNVGIPEIPEQAFGSSAAEIRMEAVDTSIIRWGAFSANTFNVVIAINCSIRDIEGEAFAQKSMINYLRLHHSKVHHLSSNALQSAIVKLEFTNNQ